MKVLVTGTSGHLGEALARTFLQQKTEYIGVDIKAGKYTHRVGDLANKTFVDEVAKDIDYVLHCATLHKPHVATHSKEDFINSNIMATLHLLEAAKRVGAKGFIFTSTTSTFGDAMRPQPNAAAVWVDEDLRWQPKNIYGVSKTAAEDLCQLFSRNEGLPTIILKVSRFFWEPDDDPKMRGHYPDLNIKANEYLNRRLDVADAVAAHLLAIEKIAELGFSKYILSATSPFSREELGELNQDAAAVVKKHYPDYEELYEKLGWKMFPRIGRVYVNEKARKELGWRPRYDFGYILDCLREGKSFKSPLAEAINFKGYHGEAYQDGIYPVN